MLSKHLKFMLSQPISRQEAHQLLIGHTLHGQFSVTLNLIGSMKIKSNPTIQCSSTSVTNNSTSKMRKTTNWWCKTICQRKWRHSGQDVKNFTGYFVLNFEVASCSNFFKKKNQQSVKWEDDGRSTWAQFWGSRSKNVHWLTKNKTKHFNHLSKTFKVF